MTSSSMDDFEREINKYGVIITRNTGKTITFKHPLNNKKVRGKNSGQNTQERRTECFLYTRMILREFIPEEFNNIQRTGSKPARIYVFQAGESPPIEPIEYVLN